MAYVTTTLTTNKGHVSFGIVCCFPHTSEYVCVGDLQSKVLDMGIVYDCIGYHGQSV